MFHFQPRTSKKWKKKKKHRSEEKKKEKKKIIRRQIAQHTRTLRAHTHTHTKGRKHLSPTIYFLSSSPNQTHSKKVFLPIFFPKFFHPSYFTSKQTHPKSLNFFLLIHRKLLNTTGVL